MLHIVVRIYPQTLMTKTFFLWKLKGKIICQHGKQKLRKRNYTTCTFNLDSYSCLVKLRTLFPLVSCLLYQNLFQWLWMHFMNVISFIRHFPGLLRSRKWPALSWLVGSVGRALHRYRRGHGFNSWASLSFFLSLFSLLLQWYVHDCENHSHP